MYVHRAPPGRVAGRVVAAVLQAVPPETAGAIGFAGEETAVRASTVQQLLNLAPLPLRLSLGIIMIAHGHQKQFGESKDQFPQMVESLGIPRARMVASVVSGLEFFGGLALICGLLTRITALGFAAEFLYIVFNLKWDRGLVQGFEFDLALLGGFLSLALLGGGAGSLDEILFG